MSVLVPGVVRPASMPAPRKRAVPTLILGAWSALFVNVLGWAGSLTLVPVPHLAGQVAAQMALPIALVLALLANRNLVVRPQLVLTVLLVTALVCVLVSVHGEFLRSSTYRAARFTEFAATLWLLSPWFGRRDMLLLRCHLAALRAVLATVVVGTMVAPGAAFAFQGRLSGTLWPIPPTQVAHYAAVLVGLTTLLWWCQVLDTRTFAVTTLIGVPLLLATHTRTALLAGAVGLVVAGCSLFLSQVRVRRAVAFGLAGVLVAVTAFGPLIATWLLRGQDKQDASQLTGRTKVWAQIGELHRDTLHSLFGNGISNMSFGGLPIDSSWWSTYLDEGWFGLVMQTLLLVAVLARALTYRPGPQQAVALFVVAYCAVASVTETGLGAPSPYLLDLAMAAAVLAPPLPRTLQRAVPRLVHEASS